MASNRRIKRSDREFQVTHRWLLNQFALRVKILGILAGNILESGVAPFANAVSVRLGADLAMSKEAQEPERIKHGTLIVELQLMPIKPEGPSAEVPHAALGVSQPSG